MNDWLEKLYAAANAAQRERMGMYSVGPFTRVWFVYRRDDVQLISDRKPDTAGVAIHCLTTQG